MLLADMVALSEELSCSVVTLQQIAEGLMQSVGYDIRDGQLTYSIN